MLKNKVEELVDKYLDEVISIRRYLHQNVTIILLPALAVLLTLLP